MYFTNMKRIIFFFFRFHFVDSIELGNSFACRKIQSEINQMIVCERESEWKEFGFRRNEVLIWDFFGLLNIARSWMIFCHLFSFNDCVCVLCMTHRLWCLCSRHHAITHFGHRKCIHVYKKSLLVRRSSSILLALAEYSRINLLCLPFSFYDCMEIKYTPFSNTICVFILFLFYFYILISHCFCGFSPIGFGQRYSLIRV